MPGDPVENILSRNGFNLDQITEYDTYEKEYQRIAQTYHFDLPVFYISIVRKEVASGTLHYPGLKWNGANNQYQYWIQNMFTGKPLRSAKDDRLVRDKIGSALSWSLSLALLALLFIVLLAIPLGKHLYKKPARKLQLFLYGIYSIPVFWMATLFITFFTTPEYGWWTNIFPSPGIWENEDSFLEAFLHSGQRLILPVLCIVVHDLAYLSRMLYNSMRVEEKKPYIVTARSKGLNSAEVTNRHLFPNARLPLVTIIIDAIPRSIAGTLIIEIIFNLPGMGRLLYESIQYHDWNVLTGILLFISICTVLIYIIGDIAYAKVNPKIELT
jgi:peptide/nickel transport system permease protein